MSDTDFVDLFEFHRGGWMVANLPGGRSRLRPPTMGELKRFKLMLQQLRDDVTAHTQTIGKKGGMTADEFADWTIDATANVYRQVWADLKVDGPDLPESTDDWPSRLLLDTSAFREMTVRWSSDPSDRGSSVK